MTGKVIVIVPGFPDAVGTLYNAKFLILPIWYIIWCHVNSLYDYK